MERYIEVAEMMQVSENTQVDVKVIHQERIKGPFAKTVGTAGPDTRFVFFFNVPFQVRPAAREPEAHPARETK